VTLVRTALHKQEPGLICCRVPCHASLVLLPVSLQSVSHFMLRGLSAGDADEPGTGFPIPNLLVCPAKPIFVARPLAQQHNKRCFLPPPLPLLAAVLKQLFEACFHQATSAST